jgi:glycosyltransferase involved in cell wall biosynthesis
VKSTPTAIKRVAYLVTHPIQYQAPLLRRLNEEPDLEVTALFRSDFSARGYVDPGFGATVAWDVPLLEGYPYKVLPAFGDRDRLGFWRPLNHGLASELRRRRYDALWIHGYGAAYHLYAMLLGRVLGVPVMLRDEAHNRSRSRRAADRLRARAVYAYMRATVSRFLAIGAANRERYLSFGIPADRIHLVPYAVDNRFFGVARLDDKRAARAKVAQALQVDPSRPQVLFAAKLQIRKRCSDLIRAFLADGIWNHPSRPVLVIAGDGEEMGLCRDLVDGSPAAEAVRFLGFQNQTALVDLYRSADIFVLTSNAEAWGLTINEAMSAGCAVLASDELGSTPDLVQDGLNGFTCRPGDIATQSARLRDMLDDPAALRRMQAASLQRIAGWNFEADVAGLRSALGMSAAAV